MTLRETNYNTWESLVFATVGGAYSEITANHTTYPPSGEILAVIDERLAALELGVTCSRFYTDLEARGSVIFIIDDEEWPIFFALLDALDTVASNTVDPHHADADAYNAGALLRRL